MGRVCPPGEMLTSVGEGARNLQAQSGSVSARRQPGTEHCRHPGDSGPASPGRGRLGSPSPAAAGPAPSQLGLPAPSRLGLPAPEQESDGVGGPPLPSPPGLCRAALSPGSVPAFSGHTQSFSQPPRWEEVPSGRCHFSRKVKSEIMSNRCLCRLQKLSSMESPKPQASEAARPASPTPSAPSPTSHLQESERLRGAVRSLKGQRSALHAQLQERE